MFKMKGRKIDFAAEFNQKSKEARQNHIDVIRKLQDAKNKLSPNNPSKYDTGESYDISCSPGMYETGYDRRRKVLLYLKYRKMVSIRIVWRIL